MHVLADPFSASPRYMNGASTNPDAHVFAYAAAQVKKGLEIAKKLGAVNYGKYSIRIINKPK